jgi:hypothetical protein
MISKDLIKGSRFSGSAAKFSSDYEISPIILMGGNNNLSGSSVPIVNLLQAASFSQGVTSAVTPGDNKLLGDTSINNAQAPTQVFARFVVPPGGTLIDNDVAHFPLANQATAANAVISKPLKINLRMIAPASHAVSYSAKKGVMTNLQNALAAHIAAGGWFNVATPSFIYQGCLLLSLRDVSQEIPGGQVQTEWEWEFEQPIISQAGAELVMNQAMAKLGSGTQTSGDPPVVDPQANVVGVAYPPVGQSIIPSATAQPGASIAPSPGQQLPSSSSNKAV